MTDERVNMFEEAMKDSDFQEKFANVESEEALKELFKTKGIYMTDEEISDFCKQVRSTLEKPQDELDAESLDDVSGGSIIFAAGTVAFLGATMIKMYCMKKNNVWRRR